MEFSIDKTPATSNDNNTLAQRVILSKPGPGSIDMPLFDISEVRARQLLDQQLVRHELGGFQMMLYLMKMTLQTSQKIRG